MLLPHYMWVGYGRGGRGIAYDSTRGQIRLTTTMDEAFTGDVYDLDFIVDKIIEWIKGM